MTASTSTEYRYEVWYVNYKGEWVQDTTPVTKRPLHFLHEEQANRRAAVVARVKAENGRVSVRKFLKNT